MILFHYTSMRHLPKILAEGLSKGDVPIVAGEPGVRGVWFTTDPEPAHHGLSGGEKVKIPESERKLIERQTGQPAPHEATTLDKRKVRIEVVIPSSDKGLARWLPWSVKRTDAALREALIVSGGGKAKARTWYIYNGTISPDRFRSICLRNDVGTFVAARADYLETLVSLSPIDKQAERPSSPIDKQAERSPALSQRMRAILQDVIDNPEAARKVSITFGKDGPKIE